MSLKSVDIENQIFAKKEFEDLNISVDYEDEIVTLNGEVPDWKTVVDIGHLVVKFDGVKNTVNNLTAKDMKMPKVDYSNTKKSGIEKGEIDSCDVVIIGAGITGCGIARELSKYNLDTIVVEKNPDVAAEATKANNGDIHPGHRAKPGTLKAKLNVKGNAMYTDWADELGFELKRVGSLLIGYTKTEMEKIREIYEVGIANNVPEMKMLNGKEVKEREPNIIGSPIGGCLAPTMGIVEPYLVAIALAENAIDNGVKFMLNTEVGDILIENNGVKGVVTNKGVIRSKYIINAAGIYADEISKMAGDQFYTIHGRRGTLLILDKKMEGLFNSITGAVPKDNNPNSKGGGAQPTVEGNILMGPSAQEVPDKENKAFDYFDIKYSLNRGISCCDKIKKEDIIAIFSGIRPADYTEDFIVEKSKKIDGFIHVAGIQSPGLASAPAIAEMVINILKDDLEKKNKIIEVKDSYNPYREEKIKFRNLSREEQDKVIAENPKYGHIICRCEQITEGEILETFNSNLKPTTIDAVKRRTRAGMGRCQGGFCQPRVLEILARENKIDPTEVTLKGENSYILNKENR